MMGLLLLDHQEDTEKTGMTGVLLLLQEITEEEIDTGIDLLHLLLQEEGHLLQEIIPGMGMDLRVEALLPEEDTMTTTPEEGLVLLLQKEWGLGMILILVNWFSVNHDVIDAALFLILSY